MEKQRNIKLLFISLLIALSGCASTQTFQMGSKNITPENVKTIERGKTSQDEIIAKFGQPITKTTSSMGTIWMYTYSVSNHSWTIMKDSIEAKGYSLMVTFDDTGIVRDYTYSESNPLQPITLTTK